MTSRINEAHDEQNQINLHNINTRELMANSTEAHDCDSNSEQFNRLDDIWRNHLETIRVNENRLTRRNVPRFLVAYTNRRICQMNCTLRLLFNAPVFIRLMLELEYLANLHFISYRNDPERKDLFNSLLKIIEMAYKESEGESVDNRLIRLFGVKYVTLYSQETDWIERDPEEFYIHIMDTLQSVANAANGMEVYSKAFEIKSMLSVDHDEIQIVNEHVIQISSTIRDFPQYIDKQYPYIQANYENERMIKRECQLLPEQIFVADKRRENGNPISYPNEFRTSRGQRYSITGAVILHTMSNQLALICRQDCVYILDDHRLLDRFHIDHLPRFFESVRVRIVLYTEVEPRRGQMCTFEDPLVGIAAEEPFYQAIDHRQREGLDTSTQFKTIPSIDGLPVVILHPILSTFPHYIHTDFHCQNIMNDISAVQSCVEQSPLYFWPRSMFAGSFIECTLVFEAPNGQYYRSHHEFFRRIDCNNKFENPTYFPIDHDNNEWFPLTLIISKSKQSQFQSDDDCSNEQGDTFQIVHYPDGEIETINSEKLLSFEKETLEKKTSRSKRNRVSRQMTFADFSKIMNINTIYLVLRRVRYLDKQKRYIPDSNIVFRSNPFRPVSQTLKSDLYDYSSDRLKISSPLRRTLLDEESPGIVHLSYSIPETYKCTALKDKYISLTIQTSNDEESHVHPLYRILNGQTGVSSMRIRAIEYSSTLDITIVRRSIDEFENDFQSYGISTNMSTTTIYSEFQSVQSIINSPGMRRFCIQLQLGHQSNDELIVYPKSTIKSEMIVDEQQILLD